MTRTAAETKDNADRAAMFAALVCLPFAIYVAGWVIDWGNGGFFTRFVLPVAFCVIVPSVIASTVAVIARAGQR